MVDFKEMHKGKSVVSRILAHNRRFLHIAVLFRCTSLRGLAVFACHRISLLPAVPACTSSLPNFIYYFPNQPGVRISHIRAPRTTSKYIVRSILIQS